MDVESCFGQSSVLFSSAVYNVCPLSYYSDLWAQPPTFAFPPFLLVLDIKGFCFLWHSPFLIFWSGGQKKGLKVCGGKFLEDISGLCSQGTSCSQCEHGTLSMRSISMTIIFILQQSGSRQHITTGKKKSFFQFDTPNTTPNILAVHINKATREEIMRRYPHLLARTNVVV